MKWCAELPLPPPRPGYALVACSPYARGTQNLCPYTVLAGILCATPWWVARLTLASRDTPNLCPYTVHSPEFSARATTPVATSLVFAPPPAAAAPWLRPGGWLAYEYLMLAYMYGFPGSLTLALPRATAAHMLTRGGVLCTVTTQHVSTPIKRPLHL